LIGKSFEIMALRYPSGAFSARGKRGTGPHKPALYLGDRPIARAPEVDAPFAVAAALLDCLKISTVIYEDALVIC
jgi:hypothetical protein